MIVQRDMGSGRDEGDNDRHRPAAPRGISTLARCTAGGWMGLLGAFTLGLPMRGDGPFGDFGVARSARGTAGVTSYAGGNPAHDGSGRPSASAPRRSRGDHGHPEHTSAFTITMLNAAKTHILRAPATTGSIKRPGGPTETPPPLAFRGGVSTEGLRIRGPCPRQDAGGVWRIKGTR